MNRIFIGMLLVFLDFNLDIGASRIGLIPDFIGYIFMIMGLAELQSLSEQFVKASPYAKVMAVYTGILYVMDIMGVSVILGNYITFVLGLLSTVASLVISYNIVMGVKVIEQDIEQDLNSQELYTAWRLLAIFSIGTYLLLIFPPIAIIGMIIAFAFGIYYLLVFNKTKKLFISNTFS